MSHFLEHVPSLIDVRKIIRSACLVSDEFVLIQQPYFDADGYLFDLGLKLYWSSWNGHPNHMTRLEMLNILRIVAPATGVKRFFIGARYPIRSSNAREIHPLLSPAEQVEWSLSKHGKKSSIRFDRVVFRELFAILLLDKHKPSTELAHYMKKRGGVIYFDSAHPPSPPQGVASILSRAFRRCVHNIKTRP
jgi:hypothetical protein